MVSPVKKKRKEYLTEAEALKVIRDNDRNMKAAALTIVEEFFMKIPLEEMPSQDLEEMDATIKKISLKLGENCLSNPLIVFFFHFVVLLFPLGMIVILIISLFQGVS